MSAESAVAHRDGLAGDYCRHLAARGTDPAELSEHAVGSALLAVAYRGRFLPAPAFLDAGERDALAQDLLTTHTLLAELPDRLFDGSRTALGSAVGMTDLQCALVNRTPPGPLTPLARADLYRTANGFRLLELNITSALGGFENASINRAMLAHPALREYTTAHDLGFTDTFQCIVDTMRRAVGPAATGERPVIALTDWPESFVSYEPRLHVMAALFAEHGYDAVPCHVGQLTEHDGGLALDGRQVDIVYRFFLLEEITTAADLAMVEPILAAEERGRTAVFSRIDAELYGNKGALALVSDTRNAAAFSTAELDRVHRFLPWTRAVRDSVTDPGGTPVDLLRYATHHQHELILKPTLLHGGNGIVPGWTVDAEEWRARLSAATGGPFVLQQRVRPVAEPFPGPAGAQPDELFLNWGVFLADPVATRSDGFAGCIVRGATEREVGVLSMGTGAKIGCCFHPVPASVTSSGGDGGDRGR